LKILGSFLLFATGLAAQPFVTGLGGVAILTADASIQGNPPAASRYTAGLGAAWNAGAGTHFSDWISVQMNYMGNRNRITSNQLAGTAYSERASDEGQHAIGGDLLVYFRPRTSVIRPYLSAGGAAVFLRDGPKPGLRLAVGIDFMTKSGWGFRYSFSQITNANPFSKELQPPGSRLLMNYHHLFGFVRYF
jgi:hypothetical protein